MTREESIEIIQKLIGRFKSDSRTYKALEMAIQALSQEPTSEKELNKAYTFGHNKGVKAYYNEQLCTVELPEAVFEYILSLVPTEETEQEPCDDAVSRKKAIWVISACDGKSAQIEALEQLPSVTQKSVIEDIKTEIKAEMEERRDIDDFSKGVGYGLRSAIGIIERCEDGK